VAGVLDRAFDALLERLLKVKAAATVRPRVAARRAHAEGNNRWIPAEVRRVVWQRDAGACTFVGERGGRCHARRFLEFDHIVPVARGGDATVENLRLRCRAHNQLEAERVFGERFMAEKRRANRRTPERAGGDTDLTSARKGPLRVRDVVT